MQKHKLTKKQARRLGCPNLAGKTVEVILYEPHELPQSLPADTREAKDVFYKGKRLGGTLMLDENPDDLYWIEPCGEDEEVMSP